MNKLAILFFIACIALPWSVYAGVNDALQITASSTSVVSGDEVRIVVSAKTPDQAINAVSGSITIPPTVTLSRIEKDGSIIDFWTEDPHPVTNRIQFEGIVLNPGYQGVSGKIFTAVFIAKKPGSAEFSFHDGALLANDGRGTNILATLGKTTVAIKNWESAPLALKPSVPTITANLPTPNTLILPVITDYSPSIDTKLVAYIKGKGAPGAVTKIVFKSVSIKSIGEKFIDFVQTKKKNLDEVLLQNDPNGAFEYTSDSNLVAGAYNVMPYLVDNTTNTERPGLGVQLLVHDSKLVHILVIAINVLGLLVPIVGLIVLIYFIPWYSMRRMHLLKRRLGLEEEKIVVSEHKLKNQDKALGELV